MKKRIVAVLLSMAMVMTTGVGTVGAADFADETVAAETIDVQPEDSEISTDDSTEETSADDASVDLDTEDGTEDPQDPVNDTQDGEDNSSVDIDFSAGEDQTADAAAGDQAVEEELNELGAGESVTSEKSVLYYTKWKNEDGKWKLLKPSTKTQLAETTEDDAVTGDTATDTDAEETTEETTEETGSDVSVQSTEEDTQTAGTSEAEDNTGDTEDVGTVTYYTDELVNVDTIDPATGEVLASGTYYFDEKGYLATGYKDVDGAHYYFRTVSEAKITGSKDPSMKTPYNSNLGQAQKHIWIWITDAFHIFGKDGKEASFQTGKLYEIGKGKYYCLNADGKPVVGDKTINNKLYTFLPKDESAGRTYPGLMASNQWVSKTINGNKKWRYFQVNGTYKKMGAGAYKLLSNSNNLYLLSSKGYIVKNTMMKGADGGVYLSNSRGIVYRNALVRKDGYRYFFLSNGKRANYKNCWVKIKPAGNRYYYFGKTTGRVQEKKGYQKVTVNKKFVGWFYFSKKGNNVQNQWVGKKYFLSDGRLASGVTKVDSKYYFFQRSSTSAYKGDKYVNTWIKYKNNYYYAYSDGTLAIKGWKRLTVDKKRYWFYFKNCIAQTNTSATRGTTKGYLDSRGRFVVGWVTIDSNNNKVRYIDPATGNYAKNKVLKINGKYYKFNSKGYRVNDRTSEYKQKSYYLVVDKVNGVMTVYTDSSMQIPIKSIRVSVGMPATPTPEGTFTVTRAGRWQELMGPSWGQYGSHVVGGIFVHSVACGQANTNNLPAGEYLKLGSPASHGCIRCCVADAKWVWDNCNGSRIKIIKGTYQYDNARKGPLGKNPLKPLRGSKTFDPTDPLMSRY